MCRRLGGLLVAMLAIAGCGTSPATTVSPDAGEEPERRVQNVLGEAIDRFNDVYGRDDNDDRDRERRRRLREREREEDNRNPRVSLDWEPSPYRLGEAILTARASDRDGDRLRFRWEALYGEIDGSGAQVIYQARYFGQDEIIVQVRDGEGGFDLDSVVIDIEDLFERRRGRFSFFSF